MSQPPQQPYSGGQGSPRRSTPYPSATATTDSQSQLHSTLSSTYAPPSYALLEEPVDTAAANAEAARLARELGLMTGILLESNVDRGGTTTTPATTSATSSSHHSVGGGSISASVSQASSSRTPPQAQAQLQQQLPQQPTQRSLLSRFRNTHSPDESAITTMPTPQYVRMPDDFSTSHGSHYPAYPPQTTAPILDLDYSPSYQSSGLIQQHQQQLLQQQQQQQLQAHSQSGSQHHDLPHVTITNNEGKPIHEFDCHGQRTPYKEGPYFVSRDKDGRLVKKRWCTCDIMF